MSIDKSVGNLIIMANNKKLKNNYMIDDIKKLSSQDIRSSIAIFRDLMGRGQLSLIEAKIKAQPYLDELNLRVVHIAKKYGKRPVKFQFAGFGGQI